MEKATDTEHIDVVRVSLEGLGRYFELCYADPTGELSEGDSVVVPYGYGDSAHGTVVGFGRKGYGGPLKVALRKLPSASEAA